MNIAGGTFWTPLIYEAVSQEHINSVTQLPEAFAAT